jgi:hypothetical protein
MKALLRVLALTGGTAILAATALPAAAQPTSNGSHPTNRQQTIALVRQIMADAPALAAAVRHDSAPDPRLRHGTGVGFAAHNVDRHTWWTIDRKPAGVRRAFHAKLAKHPRLAGLAFRSSYGFASSNGIRGDGYSAHRVSYAAGISFEVTTVKIAHGTAYRIDARAVWSWPKNAYDHVTSPTQADVFVNRPHGGYGIIVGAHLARRLARIVNHLPTFPPGAMPCPADRPHDNDVIRFHTAKGTVVVHVQATGCRRVTIRVGSHHGRALQDAAGRLNRTVRHLAG